ncbi:MAG: hypothetical protein RIC56_22045 [Pseudomonadales bacterium]
MSDDFSPIRAKSVPLSHAAADPAPPSGRGTSLLTWTLALALIAGVLAVVFYVVPAWLEASGAARPTVVEPGADPAAPPAATGNPAGTTEDPALPPFQQLQRQQAREKAQAELARFVELQIELEDSMQVGAWGEEELRRAKALAAQGDEQFVGERFEEAVASYQLATNALADLIERGRSVLDDALARGSAALEARDQSQADEAFTLAATIAPEDPRVNAGQARLALLPEVSARMREARNQELAENWSAALDTYQQVHSLDPETSGLDDALTRVADGRRRARVRTLLSQGFAHLDAARFDAARGAFRDALSLDPGNQVASGALEQVSKRADVARLNGLKAQAEAAAAAESWDEAADLYGQVLSLDATIQFAQTGRAGAEAQQRTALALQRILDSPDRLSSDKLYREARQILERAETLEPRGPQLAARIEDVRTTLTTYANPVPVVLRSDNRTQITVSSVGVLGRFEEKRLELRPGSYTVIGSRDGCRDVREQIVVRPNMNPVDIRCTETL